MFERKFVVYMYTCGIFYICVEHGIYIVLKRLFK